MRGLLQILISFFLLQSVCLGASFENGVFITSGSICSDDVQAIGNLERRNTTGYAGGSSVLSTDAYCEGASDPFDGHATLTTDLMAYYSCDAADGDDSTGNYDATPTGSPGSVAGKNNNAVDFTTGNAYLDIGAGSTKSIWTVSGWFYMPSAVGWGGTQVVISSSTYSLIVYFDTTGHPGTRGGTWYSHSTVASTDAWHHVVWSQNTSTGAMYIVLDGDWAGRLSNLDATKTMDPDNFGSDSSGLNGIQCYGDEFGIWERVLTQTEVEDLYNSGTGLFY